MYLYDKHFDKLNIYKTNIDESLLIKYKKNHLEDIKTVILLLNDLKMKQLLHRQSIARMQTFDSENNYIEEIIDIDSLNRYINGDYDKLKPIHIIGDSVSNKHFTDLLDFDYTLLYPKENNNKNSFLDDTSIILSGVLSNIQPLLYDELDNIGFVKEELYDKEFNKVIKYELDRSINYDDLKYAIKEGIVKPYSSIEEKLENSEFVLRLLNK